MSQRNCIQTPAPEPSVMVKAVEDAELFRIVNDIPSLKELNKMNKIVEKFLKSKKRIIYGGTAIEALLKVRGYKFKDRDVKLIDYDFYSPSYIKDSVEIANNLFAAGYKYVRRVNAIHSGTLRIGAEFASEFIADITNVPKSVYTKLPRIKIGEYEYIDPQFIKIDLYNSVTTPNFSVVRWEKSYKRLIALEKEYPLHKIKLSRPARLLEDGDDKICKAVDSSILNFARSRSTDMLAVGDLGFNLFVGSQDKLRIKIKKYEFYSQSPLECGKKLLKIIEPKLKKIMINCELKEKHKYLDIFTESVSIEITSGSKSKTLVNIFDSGISCIAYKIIDELACATYHYQLRFLYANYNVYGVIGNNADAKKKFIYMIQTLQSEAAKQKLSPIDPNNLFQIFQTKCVSRDPTEARLGATRMWFHPEIIIEKKLLKLYKPEKKYINPEDVKQEYMNDMLGEEKIITKRARGRKEIKINNEDYLDAE